ncbi:Proline-rich nuclear receptor coactivator motif [Sesbania bispinosa]|nr:Proline-rich nuclear receptor coactivator motif [Sesbania bispinosa]
MATQVLHPQDCLIERIRAPPAGFSRRRSSGNYCNQYYYYNNHAATSRPSRKPATRPDPRNRVAVSYGQPESASVSKRSSADDSRMGRSSGFASEKVTILRRGQSLDSSLAVRSDVYAGSAFAVSPSPSALPLPSFPTKKQSSAAFDDSATRDLRRLLRLE